MNDYMTAYKDRLERNHRTLLEMSDELKEKGCEIYLPNKSEPNRYISFIKVLKDSKICTFGFQEVPYSWYIQVSWKPNIKTGSGTTVYTCPSPDNDITVDMIIEHMRTMWKPKASIIDDLIQFGYKRYGKN